MCVMCVFTHTHTLTSVTQAALPAVWAEALEGVDAVDAGSSAPTRRRRAVVDVCRERR